MVTIKTSKLQEMVSRSVKGTSNNRLLPITQMMALRVKDNILTLITTDATNYLYIKERGIDSDDVYAVVPADQFSKLVGKMTSDNISIDVNDKFNGSLKVIGNGEYLIPIQYDESGEVVQFPEPLADFRPDETKEVQRSTIFQILTILRPALAVTMEEPCYTGYYVGEKVIATNSFVISALNVKLFDSAKLISSQAMDLLSVIECEKIIVEFAGDVTVFTDPTCTIYSRNLDGIEEFGVDTISEYLDTKFKSMCKLGRYVLLQLLDRLSLFVKDYDNGGVYLTFTKTGLQISSKNSDCVEIISYVESNGFKEFTCCVDVRLLSKQVKVQSGDTVEIWYGNESALKLVEGSVIQIIGLQEDQEDMSEGMH